MRRLIQFVLLPVLASGLLVACGGDDPDIAPVATVAAGEEFTITGGRTTIALDGITLGVLTGAGVKVAAVDPATGTDTAIKLPVLGGKITTGTLAGTIEHDGAISFVAGKRRVTYADLRIDTVAQQAYAGAGNRTPVFDLELGGVTSDAAGGAIVIRNVVAKLATAAAKELNAGLEVSAFVPKQIIGTVTIRVTGS